jgi:hypothetical protein
MPTAPARAAMLRGIFSSTLQRIMYSQKRNCAAQSQFPHLCACERSIYSTIGPSIFLQQNRQTDTVYKSITET